uniref:ARAD1D01848p n=1 Tax=Blastobotrys adeninivorans TaxID=409370 RepID=A0A060TDP2_BLAAD
MPEPLCSQCRQEAPKYKCPACSLRTCSLKCSKEHKEATGCPGLVDPTAYVPRTLYKEENLNRDYRFLQQLGRTVELGREESKDRGLRRAAPATGPRSSGSVMVRGGVKVRTLPKGMQRARMNKSGWNAKKKRYYWTLECVIYRQTQEEWACERTLVKPRVPDNIPLERIVLGLDDQTDLEDQAPSENSQQAGQSDQLEQDEATVAEKIQGKEKQEEMETRGSSPLNAKVFVKRVDKRSSPIHVSELDTSGALADVLSGQTVIEFPTLYFFFYQSQFELPNEFVNADTDANDSSSDSDSSDSDSDTDSDSSDSSGGPPEEESALEPTTAQEPSTKTEEKASMIFAEDESNEALNEAIRQSLES